jgi:hypothetical protein
MLNAPGGTPDYSAGAGCAGSAGCDTAAGGACGLGDCQTPCFPWYATISALVMTRDRANKFWTTFDTGDEARQLMNTQDISQDWRWGGELRLGRRFCCNEWAVEATYWTLDEFRGSASCRNTNPSDPNFPWVSTPLDPSYVYFDDPATGQASAWFNGAAEHRLWRSDEFHNIELNLIRNRIFCGACQPWNVDFSLGVRFFRFRERLIFGTLKQNYNWGEDGGIHEAYINDQVVNNLLGFQFGFNGEYCLFPCLKLFLTPKFGIYGNHIDGDYQMGLGDGVTRASQSRYPGVEFPVQSDKNCVSFLTQVDVGVDWQIAPHWDARIGYRVVAVTGVGLADNQIPQYMSDMPALADINHNGSLVLHGAFVGLTYNF